MRNAHANGASSPVNRPPGGIVCARVTLVVSGVLAMCFTILWCGLFVRAALPGFAAGGPVAGGLILVGTASFLLCGGFILLLFAAAGRLRTGRRVLPAVMATLLLSLPPAGTAIGIIVFAGLFNAESNAWVERQSVRRE